VIRFLCIFALKEKRPTHIILLNNNQQPTTRSPFTECDNVISIVLLEWYLVCNVGLRNALRSTVDFNKAMDLAPSFSGFSAVSYKC